jgi:hypothetical protein
MDASQLDMSSTLRKGEMEPSDRGTRASDDFQSALVAIERRTFDELDSESLARYCMEPALELVRAKSPDVKRVVYAARLRGGPFYPQPNKGIERGAALD